MSSVAGGVITSAQLNNLFDDVTGDEGAAGDVEYRCIYIHNENGNSLTLSNTMLWIQANSASANSVVDIALGGEGTGGTAEAPGDEDTAPAGETFSHPGTKVAGLALGSLDDGEFRPVWLRRTITPGASASNSDGPTIRVEGDTPA
jgi:hypothetical protein